MHLRRQAHFGNDMHGLYRKCSVVLFSPACLLYRLGYVHGHQSRSPSCRLGDLLTGNPTPHLHPEMDSPYCVLPQPSPTASYLGQCELVDRLGGCSAMET